jgi:hypothetical protein
VKHTLCRDFKLSVVGTFRLVGSKFPIPTVFFCRQSTDIYKTCIMYVSVDVIYVIIAILKKPICLCECGKYCLV